MASSAGEVGHLVVLTWSAPLCLGITECSMHLFLRFRARSPLIETFDPASHSLRHAAQRRVSTSPSRPAVEIPLNRVHIARRHLQLQLSFRLVANHNPTDLSPHGGTRHTRWKQRPR